VAALPGRHALAATKATPLRLAALGPEPWVLFPASDGPGLHATILAACAASGFTPQVAQRAVQMDTILGLVAAGLGVALVPNLYREVGRAGVVFRPLAGPGTPVPYTLALAWRSADRSPALAAFLVSSGAAVS
jgi:DNA-binding transcriptional LysR family regulator